MTELSGGSDTQSISLRDMCEDDLSQVLAIEQSAQARPWSRQLFEEALSRDHQCRVINIGTEIVAYHVCSGVLDEQHILNVVTARSYRNQGLGHRLMQDIFDLATAAGRSRLFLEVRASNQAAQNLYGKWGFQQAGIRKGYYRSSDETNGQPEDALIYLRELEE